jgi:peptide/nickel transport system substrate-binding protein
MFVPRRRAFALLLALLTCMGACAPAAEPSRSPSQPSAPAPAQKKTLTLAMQQEPIAFIRNLHTGIQGDTGREPQHMLHDQLVVEIEYERHYPQLAVELPSIEKGTWRVNADGTMDTTWKLKPNVKWHDGHPFTSADLLFTFQLNKDRDLVQPTSETSRLDTASAVDDLTFNVHWGAPYLLADRDNLREIAPKHLLEQAYLVDKARFTSQPYFTTEFVGLGPYRLVKWELGSHLEMARFEDYHQGRPPFDTIFVRFVPDPNTAVANIMSGAVDAIPSSSTEGIDLDNALEVQQRWTGTGNQVQTQQTGRVMIAEPQFRPEFARPRNGMSSLPVRQALYHAIDRRALAETMTHGLSPVADSYILPVDPMRPQLESFIPQYPYDPARARQLMATAGWTPGSDGVFTHSSGERFEIDVWGRQGGGNDKIIAILGDAWKAIGLAPNVMLEPTALQGDREYESTRPGFLIVNPSGTAYFDSVAKLHTRSIPTTENRWRGSNYGAFSSPRVDDLIDRLQETVDPRERIPLHQQLVQEHMANVAMFPLYWQVVPVLMLKGIKGPRPNQKRPMTNIFEWNRE